MTAQLAAARIAFLVDVSVGEAIFPLAVHTSRALATDPAVRALCWQSPSAQAAPAVRSTLQGHPTSVRPRPQASVRPLAGPLQDPRSVYADNGLPSRADLKIRRLATGQAADATSEGYPGPPLHAQGRARGGHEKIIRHGVILEPFIKLPLTCRDVQSGRRESNPRSQFGRLGLYH